MVGSSGYIRVYQQLNSDSLRSEENSPYGDFQDEGLIFESAKEITAQIEFLVTHNDDRLGCDIRSRPTCI